VSGAVAKSERVSARVGAAIGAVCGLAVALLWVLGLLRPLDLRIHDWRYRLRGAVPASDRIALVEIDSQTLSVFGDVWPLPREHYAIAIDALQRAGVQAVALDLLFLGDSPENPVGDQLLASVTGAHANVVQSIGFQRSDGSLGGLLGPEVDSVALIRHGRPISRQRLAAAQSVSLPYRALLANSREVGHTAVLIDADGVIRRIPQFVRLGEWAYPSLVLRLIEVAARGDTTLPQFELEEGGVMIHWHGRRLQVPIDVEGATSIAFAGDENAFANRYSLLQVLQWYRDDDTTSLAKAFRGKLALIGVTAIQQHASDVGATPYSSSAPLLYIHANAVNAALHGRFLHFVPPAWIVTGLIALGVGLGLLYSRLPMLWAGFAAVGALLAVGALDYGLFVLRDLDLPAVGALLVPPITWAAVENAWRRDAEHRSRLRAKELSVAHSIQEHLLPSAPPRMENLDVFGSNLPAESIGGDYFDWIQLEDDFLAVVVGDVSGHGIPAALLMAHLRASFHAEARAGRSAEEIVSTVNHSLARATSAGKFATFFLGIISVSEKRLRYCNAGHNSPLLVRGEEVRELGATGVPLAIMEDMPYTGGEEAFEAGDTLVIYSDGIPEAEVRRGQANGFYGEARLQNCARTLAASGANAAAIGAGLLDDLRRVAGEGMRGDDVTLVVVRRT
jgi:serine phosphatase RsbU (regulator of sigma subunit)/CHASE2 domain-containing sensor protein